jgi:transcription elongation factor Elf1
MTSETKKFIEFSDILSIRFECKHCGSELVISSLRDMGKREEQGKLSNCPVCTRPWASVNGSTCESTITGFLDALNKVRESLGSFPAGFLLTLEVASEEPPA